jgi:ERCC4-related helicase
VHRDARVPHASLLPGETVRIRDERWVVTRQTPGMSASVLDVRGQNRSNRDELTSFLLPFEIVERLTSDRSPRRVRARRWRQHVRALLCDATPLWPSLRAPVRADISLMAFQLEPALAVTHGIASRILIADEVGLGKTIQAALIIAEILERARHGRVLVVSPASLREQWQGELHHRFRIDAWLADSASLARLGAAWGTANPWSGRPVTITSIDFIKRPEVMRSLEALVWDAVVFDEAHGLAGLSDRAAAAGALARRARTVVMLTATPHSGDQRAFASLCGIGDLAHSFPLLTFRRTRRDVGLAVSRRTMSLRVRPTLAEREMHRALAAYADKVRTQRGAGTDAAHLAMMVLTRRACSSAASLARSVERRLDLLDGDGSSDITQLMLPMFEHSADEEPGAELSAPGLDDRHEERRRLERILLLAHRAQTAESKIVTLTRLLRRTHEPAIVFTEYRDTLMRLADALHVFAPLTLHGGLNATERRDAVRAFTNGAARLLLATDAASEGLNLQRRCRLVVNLELPWTPVRLEQRIGRVERIGQSRRVHALHLVAAGTREESYVTNLVLRSDMAADALEQLRQTSPEIQHMRGMAHAETVRLEQLRKLMNPHRDLVPETRPLVTLRRRRSDGHGILWAFCLGFTDATNHVLWRTVLAARTVAHHNSRACLTSIDAAADVVASRLDGERKAALASLVSSLRPFSEMASRREHAIADALEHERARLSARLLQRSLFDRRVERTYAAQSAVIDQALTRCRTRLDELAAATQIAPEPGRLAFVLIR